MKKHIDFIHNVFRSWFFSEEGGYARRDCAEGLEFEIPGRRDCAEGLEFGGAKRRRKFWGFKVYRCLGKGAA